MAMAQMVKHAGEMGGGSDFCPLWDLFGQSAQSAQNAYFAWMPHRLEVASLAQPTFVLRRAFCSCENSYEKCR